LENKGKKLDREWDENEVFGGSAREFKVRAISKT
jgi:hypothetical protein